jgi:hypothetical protein
MNIGEYVTSLYKNVCDQITKTNEPNSNLNEIDFYDHIEINKHDKQIKEDHVYKYLKKNDSERVINAEQAAQPEAVKPPELAKRKIFKFANTLTPGSLIERAKEVSVPLENLRIFQFGSIQIAGSRLPDKEQVSFIEDHFHEVVVLDSSESGIGRENKKLQLNYIVIKDYSSPQHNQFMKLLSISIKAEQAQRNVFAHCDFGGGRTGTMLASLVLYQHFASGLSKGLLPDLDNQTVQVNTPVNPSKYLNVLNTHPFVAAVLDNLRALEVSQSNEGMSISVETQGQINTIELQMRALTVAAKLNSGELITDEKITTMLKGRMTDNEFNAFYAKIDVVEYIKADLAQFIAQVS